MNELKPEDVMRALAWYEVVCENIGSVTVPPNELKAIAALLREKDAEIERLQGAVEQYEEERKYHFEMSRKRIAEAIDEFADALEKHFCHDPAFLGVEQRLIMDVVKQKTKELKGEIYGNKQGKTSKP